MENWIKNNGFLIFCGIVSWWKIEKFQYTFLLLAQDTYHIIEKRILEIVDNRVLEKQRIASIDKLIEEFSGEYDQGKL